MNKVSDSDDGDSDAEFNGDRDDEPDGDKDAELEGDRAPIRQTASDKDEISEKGKRLPGPAAPSIPSRLNADSLHPHIVKLILLCGVGDHERQAWKR